jgi:hypothetical protein
MPYTAVMATDCTVLPRADCATRFEEVRQAQWFDVDLPIHFFSQATEVCGIGLTRRISRDAVMFASSGAPLTAGDELRYLLLFPKASGKAGAVGLCRGRVVRADAVVVVTIDRCRLQSATAVRASRDARTRRLATSCLDARPGHRETIAMAPAPTASTAVAPPR